MLSIKENQLEVAEEVTGREEASPEKRGSSEKR